MSANHCEVALMLYSLKLQQHGTMSMQGDQAQVPPSPRQLIGIQPFMHNKKIDGVLHPSIASLGDGLLSSAGSQRDEAKRQNPAVTGLEPKT